MTVERHVLALGPTRSLVAVVDDPQCVTSKRTRAFCFTVERMQVRPRRKLGKENTLASDEGRQEQF